MPETQPVIPSAVRDYRNVLRQVVEQMAGRPDATWMRILATGTQQCVTNRQITSYPELQTECLAYWNVIDLASRGYLNRAQTEASRLVNEVYAERTLDVWRDLHATPHDPADRGTEL